MSECCQNLTSSCYPCLFSPFSRILLIKKVRVWFSEGQILFWKFLVIDLKLNPDQLYYMCILLVVRRIRWEHILGVQNFNAQFSTMEPPYPWVPHPRIQPTTSWKYPRESQEANLEFAWGLATIYTAPALLGITGDLEMLWRAQEAICKHRTTLYKLTWASAGSGIWGRSWNQSPWHRGTVIISLTQSTHCVTLLEAPIENAPDYHQPHHSASVCRTLRPQTALTSGGINPSKLSGK